MLFRHPRTTGESYYLLKPFTKTVWLCALLSWVLMVATIHLVNWLESRQNRHGQRNSDHSWGATILTILGAISEQGNSLTVLSVVWKEQGFECLCHKDILIHEKNKIGSSYLNPNITFDEDKI
jgi:hypothetical protein